MDDISLAAELVREAGTLASEMLSQGLETRYKTSLSDVVSAADHAGEELISARLADSRPDDGLVGEEGARKAGEGRTWYVDPVDGTYNFLSGIPYWCSAVGLVDADGPLLGRSIYPTSTSCGWEVERLRPRSTENRCRCCSSQGLSEISIATYFHPRHLSDRQRLIRVAVGGGLGRYAANTRIRLDRLGRRREQPARRLPAGQSQRVGLVSRRGAGHRCRRSRRRTRRRREPLADRRQCAGRRGRENRTSSAPALGPATISRTVARHSRRLGAGALLRHSGDRGGVAEAVTIEGLGSSVRVVQPVPSQRLRSVATTIDSASTRK